jgi:hypothetical protein
VRSASTGHKAKNRGPVNVTDFLLIYEKRARGLALPAAGRARRGYDPAYGTYLVNPTAPDAEWRFEPLARTRGADLGYASALARRRALGAPRSTPRRMRSPSRTPTTSSASPSRATRR